MRRLLLLSSAVALTLGIAGGCGDKESIPPCDEGLQFVDGQCLHSHGVKVNSVGYLPGRAKVATFGGESASFEVRSAEDDSVVLEGDAEGPVSSLDTPEMLYLADFSALDAPGRYYIQAGPLRSAEFSVGEKALNGATDLAMLGLYGLRCGVDVDLTHNDRRYNHSKCHTADASLSRIEGESGTQSDIGGWHDAGDYGKYTPNGAFAVAFLLKAYEHFPEYLKTRSFEIPEKDNDVPDILDEARVELEWLLKVQLKDDSFAHKVTAEKFEANIMPESHGAERFFFSTSTQATGDAVAVLALAARIYEEYDADFAAECLDAAERGQAFLDEHPEMIESEQGVGQNMDEEGTGTYASSSDQDDRMWALVELWETTGKAEYLGAAEGMLEGNGLSADFDWANVGNLGSLTYITSEREGRDEAIVADYMQKTVLLADSSAGAGKIHGYGRAFTKYYWGTDGVTARFAYNFMAAHRLFPSTDYLDAITAQADYLLGRNYHGRSYVTVLGVDGPKNPHHRPSIADSNPDPWPGLLIGGPHDNKPWGGEPSQEIYPATNWQDVTSNYVHNEIAINWNTALVYALVAAEATQADMTLPCHPSCLDNGTGGAGGAGQGGGAGESSAGGVGGATP